MPCKKDKQLARGNPVAQKTIVSLHLRASWKPVNPQECVRENQCYRIIHEDHVAGKRRQFIAHHDNLVQKFIPMPQAMKIPAAKAAVGKEWEKSEKIPTWNLTKVINKSEGIDEARTKRRKTEQFASLMDICHLKNAELETKHQKYKGRVVLRGDTVKDDSGSYAVFTEEASSASQMTAAKVIGYHFNDYLEAQDKQLMQYLLTPMLKSKMLRNHWKFQHRSAPAFGFVYHDTNGRNLGPVWKIQSFFLGEICMVTLWQDCCGNGNPRKFYWSTVGRKLLIGNVSTCTSVKKDFSCLCVWMT